MATALQLGDEYTVERLQGIAPLRVMAKLGAAPHVLPLAFFSLAQAYQSDLTRSATMTASQVMLGYAFILGVYYHPDQAGLEPMADQSL